MREESHGTEPLRWVGSVRFGSGFWFWFGFADSQYQASTPLESMCGRSLGNLQGVPHLSPSAPLLIVISLNSFTDGVE